ncbi:hypothetical protein [Streptomyces sp. V2I9]|uniref:hypothetical protein n=1 Tax=Streptomyces sp. V2I9 TaxID=3042304 RepID=UPI00278A3571|nr:hypothetical protein [Streptomyces sp. V2I9]MDQ0987936.1 hypothetical protein [Streptomyces sp. V2I9]
MDEPSRDRAGFPSSFTHAPPSRLSSHLAACCVFAREVLVGGFAAQLDVASALARIPERLPWGDTQWPSHWCDAARASAADSGVHAELASAVLDRYGVEHRRGKAVLSAPPSVVAHWRERWRARGSAVVWLAPPGLIYREVLAVAGRWWDPTDSCWIEHPGGRTPAGTVLALAEDGGDWAFGPGHGPLQGAAG